MSEVAEILERAIRVMRDEIDYKKDIPAYWMEFFLAVASTGEKGGTVHDITNKIGMQQAIASRVVSILGEGVYIDTRDKVTKTGVGLFSTSYDDPHYRHRKTIRLAPKGKALLQKLEDMLG